MWVDFLEKQPNPYIPFFQLTFLKFFLAPIYNPKIIIIIIMIIIIIIIIILLLLLLLLLFLL